MDLIPVSAEQVGSGTVQIDARRRQLIGVTTSEVVTQDLTRTIHAVGIVRYDETALVEVSPRVHGWIGEVFIDFTGKPVRKGESLFTLYSPELLSAQGEYLEALRLDREAAEMGRVGRDHALVAAARRRLALWELTEDQIQSLHQDGQPYEYVTFTAPASGIVVGKSITEGSPARPGQVLYRITSVDPVWIEAELHEADLSLVREGLHARIVLSYLPEEEFSGVVAFVYPYLTDTTRTGRIRIEIPNPRGVLKPDMYADVELEIPLGVGLVAPEGAVLFAGKRRFVFVDLGEGFLAPREVRLGARVAEGYQILEGLSAGEVVVSSGNFLVAADAQLRAAMESW
jgi:Cu(I)/Ag(I) efflux system membrane fusion protein